MASTIFTSPVEKIYSPVVCDTWPEGSTMQSFYQTIFTHTHTYNIAVFFLCFTDRTSRYVCVCIHMPLIQEVQSKAKNRACAYPLEYFYGMYFAGCGIFKRSISSLT